MGGSDVDKLGLAGWPLCHVKSEETYVTICVPLM